MFTRLLKKLFRIKGAAAPLPPEITTKAPSRSDPARLIPMLDIGKRRNRRALLGIENLDPQSRAMISNMQFMTDEEIHGPRKPWSDPL